ncbi:unnamed protein product [Prunus armeniaca]
MTSPWPFAQWGLDLIGPMPQGTGQLKLAVVVVDYFTKWTEVEALTTITAAKIEHFVWKNILCRFGLPNVIVTDNGKPFDCSRFRHLRSRFNISIFFASPAHPQSNGQVEAINKIIKKTLKKKLGAAKGNWPAILPEALWAINTSYRRSTGETPFSLAFGTEAVVPVEVHAPTCRTPSYNPQKNEQQLALNLDLIDEHRSQAQLQNATYKQRTARYYDSHALSAPHGKDPMKLSASADPANTDYVAPTVKPSATLGMSNI